VRDRRIAGAPDDRAELGERRVNQPTLPRALECDLIRVAIGREGRQTPPMTRAWIAAALHTGIPSCVSDLLAE